MTSVSTQDPVSEDLKRYRRGTHRACDPSETYDHLRALMPRCGITRIANITGLDRVGVPVYTAIRPNSRALSTSQGKGMDRDAARASALMEAFESWHGERVSADGGYYRREEAEDENGIPVADVGRISRRGRDVSWLSSTRINWVRGLDVMSGVAVLLPYDCVSSDFTGDVQRVAFIRSTNGLASGNTLTEATLHGLYEVIERDAVALWSPSAGTADRVVDPGTVHDEDNAALLDRLADAGLGVLIRDVRCDTTVPVFAVAIAPTNPTRMPPFAAFSGYGAHLDPRVALSRALTEAIQSRLTVIHGGRDDLWPSAYARVLDHRAARNWARFVSTAEPTVDFERIPDHSTETFSGDLEVLKESIASVAAEAIAVDLTRPGLGIPVVKVVVPGLSGIPFDPRPRDGGRVGSAAPA